MSISPERISCDLRREMGTRYWPRKEVWHHRFGLRYAHVFAVGVIAAAEHICYQSILVPRPSTVLLRASSDFCALLPSCGHVYALSDEPGCSRFASESARALAMKSKVLPEGGPFADDVVSGEGVPVGEADHAGAGIRRTDRLTPGSRSPTHQHVYVYKMASGLGGAGLTKPWAMRPRHGERLSR